MTSQIFLDRRFVAILLAAAAVFLAGATSAHACQTPDDGDFVAAAAHDTDPGAEPSVCRPPDSPMITRPATLVYDNNPGRTRRTRAR
jgi:hypothetical protein